MKKKICVIAICALMTISAFAVVFVVNTDSNKNSESINDILNTNVNKVVCVSTASDFDDATYGNIIFVNEDYEESGEFNYQLNKSINLCYPVITNSGYKVFSDAGLSIAYPDDAKYVGYCKDVTYGNNDCKAIIGFSETDSVKGLCEWANECANKVIEVVNKTEKVPVNGIFMDTFIAFFDFWRTFYENTHQVTYPNQDGNDSSAHWGTVTESNTDYNADGRGVMSVRTEYREYSTEDSSRRYFIVHYFVEVKPNNGYRTADVNVISDVDADRGTQRLEGYAETTTSGTSTHTVSLSIGTDGVSASDSWEYTISDVSLCSNSCISENYYELWYDVNQDANVGKNTLKIEPGTTISTDKADENGSLKVHDTYKVNFCKFSNSNGDWWRIWWVDKCYNFVYYSTTLYVEIE